MEKYQKEINLAAGRILKKFRLEVGISRKELGERLSCTSQAISQFEINGIGRNETIIRVCRALDVQPSEFFYELESVTKKQCFKKADVISPELLKTSLKCPHCEKKITMQVFIAPFIEQ